LKPVVSITPQFAVTGALEPADFKAAAAMGFKAIIGNLPDGESPKHPTSAEAARLAAEAGLTYVHVPITKFDLLSERVQADTIAAVRAADGPVLAHCFSGLRSAMAWGVAAARFQDAEAIVATLAKAGFNATPLREELASLKAEDASAAPPVLRASAST